MTAKTFLDTNVVVYLVGEHKAKTARAETLLETRPTISVQVVNEFINVTTRKLGLTRLAVYELAETLMRDCDVVPLTATTLRRAMRIGQRYGFSHWDSLILAAAIEADCDVVYSEDMQHGQQVDGVRVVNPFLEDSAA
ncbi:PIN domain-containing protein [Andreprevotia chitinilytica]|uniref:PIN domain-containing protein n=1 Tax=Andreprevotia chitinilytica TaxID=396808 RepID=UPI00054D768A|nr:PIN domain-containing protein [Andreprevotia chitinilytica]